MRYLCLIYENEKNYATMPKGESDNVMAEYGAFTQGIKESGHYVGGNALQPRRQSGHRRTGAERLRDLAHAVGDDFFRHV